MAERLRLVTYNIRKGKGASGRAKYAVRPLGEALCAHAPDLVLCQEVFHGHAPGSVSQSEELAALLGLSPCYEPNKKRGVGHHGNATFTRHEIVELKNHDVSTNRIERRGVLYSRLALSTGYVHVFNAHLGLNQWQRATQVRRIGAILSEKCNDGAPVLLAGDFNDWNGRIDRMVTRELGLTNAFGHLPPETINTWHARRPVFNLDRVYVRGATVALARRLDGAPWSELSDHLPLWVELELNS